MGKPKKKSKQNDEDLFDLDLSEPLFDEDEFIAELDALKTELLDFDFDGLMDWSEFDGLFDD